MSEFLHSLKKVKFNFLYLLVGIFLASVTILLYTNLGRDYLFDWDEGIYAELGVEMRATGNILTPSWNGSPWLEKPPGISWVTATTISLFGQNSFGARAAMPVFALITLYSLFLIGKKLGGVETGIIAMSLLAYFDLFLGRARGVNTDGVLIAAITSSVALALYDAKVWQLALAIALGIMFKGPAGALSFLVVLPIIYQKGFRYLLSSIFYILIFTLPWHLYALIKYGQEFVRPYLLEQVIRRASTPIEFHIENRYFYLTYLYENLKIGILFVAGIGFLLMLKKRLYWPSFWALLVLGIFTVAKTRIFWYILPVYPVIALACAYTITYFFRGGKNKVVLWILMVGIVLQSISKVSASVELNKKVVAPSDKILVAQYLHDDSAKEIIVYVPKIERVFAQIMPESARISSTFRYGGMPGLLFYLGKPVKFFYTRQEMRDYWDSAVSHPTAIFAVEDKNEIPAGYDVLYENKEFIAVRRNQVYLDLREASRRARELAK